MQLLELGLAWYEFTGHEVQAVAPEDREKVPAAQLAQLVRPAVAAILPAAHAWHAAWPESTV